MQVHVMGTVYCTKAAWQIMRAQRYGRVVVTTSGSGTVGNFGQANYGAAKMAVNGFINVLRHEGQNYNIKLNAISPSARTRMTESLIPAEVAEWMKPELVSPIVAYMCSEQCEFSGEILGANAGHFRRVKYIESEGVYFDPAAPVTLDMVAENIGQIMDLSKSIEHGMSSRRLRERLVAMGRIPA
jgi:NAD(P)-dependent dehydrogenase (short-subunit alcohol dehydrogenase family)